MDNLIKCGSCEHYGFMYGEPYCEKSEMYIKDIIICVDWDKELE